MSSSPIIVNSADTGKQCFFRLLHWGPCLALTVIGVISSCTIICDLQWWPPTTIWGGINLILFSFWVTSTLYNFFNAAFLGPGHVTENWKPDDKDDEKKLQFCFECKCFKSPRSHHCRKCKKCVIKMDHHCPWINNCVGHFNQANFVYFLTFAPIGCIHALCVLIPAIYRALSKSYYIRYGNDSDPIITLGIFTFIMSMLAVGLSLGVIIALGGLLFIQLRSISKNETAIESWINDKAKWRRESRNDYNLDENDANDVWIFPYNLGYKKNFNQVFNSTYQLNGIWWPVRENCNQYTFTEEQLKQKINKRERAVIYKIVENYNGSWFPLSKGCCVAFCPPCIDEPRIPLKCGDKVLVTRWRKRWLYGDQIFSTETKRVRGWFPRRCGRESSLDNGYKVLEPSPKEEKKTQ